MPICKPDKKGKVNEDTQQKWTLTTTMDAHLQGIVNLNLVPWLVAVLLFPLLLPTHLSLAILRSMPFLPAKRYMLQVNPLITHLKGNPGLFPVAIQHPHLSAGRRRQQVATDSHPTLPGQDLPSRHQYLAPMI